MHVGRWYLKFPNVGHGIQTGLHSAEPSTVQTLECKSTEEENHWNPVPKS